MVGNLFIIILEVALLLGALGVAVYAQRQEIRIINECNAHWERQLAISRFTMPPITLNISVNAS